MTSEQYRFSPEVQAVLEGSPIPFAVYQLSDHRVVTVLLSDGFVKLSGASSREECIQLMNTDMYRYTDPADVARIEDLAYRFAIGKDEVYDAVYRSKLPDQNEYHLLHSMGRHITVDGNVQLAMIWYMDETSASQKTAHGRELMDALIESAEISRKQRENYYDDMTGLPTAAYFRVLAESSVKTMRAEGKTPAIIYLDFSNMRLFNHRYGFAKGDELIRGLGKLLSRVFGTEHCGHVESDHFAVYTDADYAEKQLDQLFASLNQINHGNVLPLRAGIYVLAEGDYDISRACDRAKAACNHLRGQFASRHMYFNEQISKEISGKAYVLDNFTRALSEHWIQAYFQRIVDPETGKVTDEEALARWIDPQNGLLPPDQFIPILEDEGMLWKLDLYMGQLIIQSMRKKQQKGIPLVPVSINLSERDFTVCDMIDKLARRMDEAGIERKYLVIEITERAIGRDPELLKQIIEECGNSGFRVWLDDFGSDYSSLNILSNYHFDVIKLDQKFLRTMQKGNQKGKLLIAEILDFAKKADITALAEGVETREEAVFLMDHGVNKIQGFLFSRPEPEKTLLEWYQSHQEAVQPEK